MDRIEPEELEKLLPAYRRWEAEGRRPYMFSHGNQPPAQFYYDSYHDSIRQNADGTYEFDIQVDGAPEGDTWVRGKFVIENDRVRIIEQRAYFT